MQPAKLIRECVGDLIQIYRKTYNRDPSDSEIKTHMKHMGRPTVASWPKPDEHFKVDELSRKGVTLVESTNMSKYNWVVVEVVGTPTISSIEMTIDTTNIMVGDPSDWLVLTRD